MSSPELSISLAEQKQKNWESLTLASKISCSIMQDLEDRRGCSLATLDDETLSDIYDSWESIINVLLGQTL